jgi:hypothetical protein
MGVTIFNSALEKNQTKTEWQRCAANEGIPAHHG